MTEVSIILGWQKITSRGTFSAIKAQSKPGPGLWVASFKVPFTDDQGTMEYFAIDGVIMLPRFCVNGQQRDAALREALRHL